MGCPVARRTVNEEAGLRPGLSAFASGAALAGYVDQFAADGLVGAALAGRDTLGVPEDFGDAVRRSEKLFSGREVQVLLVAARLYQGQTTNFRTAGGGFAPVFKI